MSFGLFDNHTHSVFSSDGKMSIRNAALAAKEIGLSGLCITDHYDFDVPVGAHDFTFNISSQQQELQNVRDELGIDNYSPEGFRLLNGVEIGVQAHCTNEIDTLMSSYRFDCVLASLHFIDGKDPFHGNYYLPYGYKEAYRRYLEEFFRCISLFHDFDILAHFDYIARYSPYKEATIFYSDFSDVIDSIFSLLIAEGKTFEINTKTYQLYRGKEPQFDTAMLKRFRELGGEAVSFGSDAHDTPRISDNFEMFREIVKKAGIKYEVWYRGRKPQYLEL